MIAASESIWAASMVRTVAGVMSGMSALATRRCEASLAESEAESRASPVPRGSDWMATVVPSPMAAENCGSAASKGDATTTMRSTPDSRRIHMACSSSVRPHRPCRGFGKEERMREPAPAARITPTQRVLVM